MEPTLFIVQVVVLAVDAREAVTPEKLTSGAIRAVNPAAPSQTAGVAQAIITQKQ